MWTHCNYIGVRSQGLKIELEFYAQQKAEEPGNNGRRSVIRIDRDINTHA
jgi:hypothetical protein